MIRNGVLGFLSGWVVQYLISVRDEAKELGAGVGAGGGGAALGPVVSSAGSTRCFFLLPWAGRLAFNTSMVPC